MSRAATEPSFEAAGAPVSVLIDFDGTISLEDVGDRLLERLVEDQLEISRQDRRYHEGRVGSRELIGWCMDVLPRDPEVLRAEAMRIGVDPGLVDLVSVVKGMGGAIEVVSDGIGFHIEPLLATLGLEQLPVATNMATLGEGASGVNFAYGNSDCFVCGTCKRERVRRHQAAGRAVVFIGDGTSDRYAAHHADVVFAKDALARWCAEEDIEHVFWDRLTEVAAWVSAASGDGRLPGSPADYGRWRDEHGPATQSFICGPEVWGPGRTVAASSEPGSKDDGGLAGPGQAFAGDEIQAR
jgi:2-hydroxy-3-keto-5-methylthiopentenyl-1-phosphate phosphatase